MPKKKETQASKAEAFQSALAGLAEAKGITVEAVLDALHDALERAYIKYLDQGDDVRVKVDIDQATGTIVLAQIKTVVEEVEDDALEISKEDANEGLKKAKFNIGDDFEFPCPVEELSKLTAMAVKSILRQKIAEAERSALYEIYKDHIGEMVTGVVEKADDRSVTVNIGRTTVELTRREMIGDEYYKVGDQIKVYIQEVKSARPVEEGEKTPKEAGYGNAFIVGVSQGIATLPGISRSGTTITMGLICGFEKRFAVKYSFIMSIPAVLGAAVLEVKDVVETKAAFEPVYLLGMAVAAVVGYGAIKLMLNVVKNKRYIFFSVYCFIIGLVAVAGSFIIK